MPPALTEGSEVIVTYLASSEAGVVESVDETGRTVVVVTEHGTVLEFHLMASMVFSTRDRSARIVVP